MKPHVKHRHGAPRRLDVRIVTVSSSRYAAKKGGKPFDDQGGDTAESETRKGGHRVTLRVLVSDDARMIKKEMAEFLKGGDDVIVFTGGTGVSRRDVTVETVRPYLEKELVGFGEQFRRASFDEVGAAALLTRSTAGVVGGKVVLCLPGSPGGVKTALRLFLGELPHVVHIARS